MKKFKVLRRGFNWPIFIILTATLVVSGFFIFINKAQAGTLYVCPEGPEECDYDSIQVAIDAASSGDTINVADGTYTITAAININKGVTITGNIANPGNVLIKYNPVSSTLNCVEVNSADVTIQGIKVQDCQNGFHFDRSDNTNTGVTISNCIIESVSGWGIGEISSPNTLISHNTITNAGDKGIYFRLCEGTSESNRCEAISNVISGCGQSAIQTFGSKYAYIYGNTIGSTNDKGINIIKSGAIGTADRVQVIGNIISETKWPGIQVIGAPYTYVYDNTLTKCNYYGGDSTGDWDYASIHVQDDSGPTYSHYTVIDSNTVSDGINGIQTWSNDVTITNNEIYNMGVTYADEKVVDSRTYKNSGILVGSNWGSGDIDPTGVVIENNNIHDNYWGLFYSTDLTNGVIAEYNYWGCLEGPSNVDCDAVSANVDFVPFYTDVAMTTESTEYSVCDSGCNFINIQDAIDAASDGDTINVADGTYDLDSPISIDKPITLIGDTENPSNVIINAGSIPVDEDRDGFQVKASDITIKGFKIQGAIDTINSGGQNMGIAIGTHWAGEPAIIGLQNIVISYNEITDCSKGIYIYRAQHITISHNKIHDIPTGTEHYYSWPGKGIELRGDGPSDGIQNNDIDILNNEIYDCAKFGIELNHWEVSLYEPELTDWIDVNVLIDGNKIYDNGGPFDAEGCAGKDHGRGISANGWETGVTITNNEIYDHWFTGTKFYHGAAGIRVNDDKGFVISNNNVHDNMRGIYIYGSDPDMPMDANTGFIVTNNTVHKNAQGIVFGNGNVGYAHNNNIYNNNVATYTGDGIDPSGAVNLGTGTLDARSNYWGDFTGPGGVASGSGDFITANIDYSPWYTDIELTSLKAPTTTDETGSTVLLTQPIDIISNDIIVSMPAGITITATASWEGIIDAPSIETVALDTPPRESGHNTVVDTIIEIGYSNIKLVFNKAVRILIPNQAGKQVGYVRPGEDFQEITNFCLDDIQTINDDLPDEGDCKIPIGTDLAVWTKHFTQFIVYSYSPIIITPTFRAETPPEPEPEEKPSALSEEAQKLDTNKDDKINDLDLKELFTNWGSIILDNIADFNNDSKVDVFDFNLLMVHWTE